MWDSYDESMTLRLLDEANYDAEMESKVLPALDACMTEGWMDPATVDWNGDALPKLDEPGRLHYCCYDAAKFDALREDGASGIFRGVVVISHGFTEFARKYSEMAWYFLLSGYSVCILEHRGHGHSAHDVSNPSLVWIDDWRRYVADFAAFADTVGREYACGEPLNLYCHSMGGGIGAAVMEHYPSLFDKAVLSAPMIAPVVGMRHGSHASLQARCAAWDSAKRAYSVTPIFPPNSISTSIRARPRRAFAGSTSSASTTWHARPTRPPSNGRIRRWHCLEPYSNRTCAVRSKLRRCCSKRAVTSGS